jgi:hypothetical protein
MSPQLGRRVQSRYQQGSRELRISRERRQQPLGKGRHRPRVRRRRHKNLLNVQAIRVEVCAGMHHDMYNS